MFSVNSIATQAGRSSSARLATAARGCLVFLLSIIVLTGQTVGAAAHVSSPAARVSKQLANLPIGAAVKVRLVEGGKLQGELVGRTETSFEVLQAGEPAAQEVKCADVKSIKAIQSPRRGPNRGVTVALVGAFLAGTGVLIALAGFVI